MPVPNSALIGTTLATVQHCINASASKQYIGACAQVSKPVPNVATFEALCNELAAGSFDDKERDVSFAKLDKVHARTVGLFGYQEDVWKVLRDHGAPESLTAL